AYNYLVPCRHLLYDETAKLRGRAGLGHRTELGESGFDLLACECLVDERIELVHDGGRGAGGCNHAGPDIEGDIWKTFFEHGWNLRHLAPPLRARDRKRPQPSVFGERRHRGNAVDGPMRHAAKEIGDGGR